MLVRGWLGCRVSTGMVIGCRVSTVDGCGSMGWYNYGDDMVINLYNQVLAIIAASIIMVHMKY